MQTAKVTRCLIILIAFMAIGLARSFARPPHLSKDSRQLIIVLNSGWDNLHARMYVYNQVKNKWKLQFTNPVVLGSKGLAIGDGLIQLPAEGPIKHEGDKRSPAGVFSIGTAFGYAPKKQASWIKDRYVQAFDTLICVDDSNSAYYNTLVDKDTAKADYRSFEYMHLKKVYYKWGLFINHNSGKVVPGDGSCIFMHIWEDKDTGTDGCTAMTENNMLRVLRWINRKNKPILVQMPVAAYEKIRRQYKLPFVAFH